MKHTLRYFSNLLLLILALNSSAQDQFERQYPTNDVEVITSSATAAGTGYGLLAGELNMDNETDRVNVTYLNTKGNINRSFSITFNDSALIKNVGSIIRLENGNYIISAILDKDSLNKVVCLADPSTNILFTAVHGQETDTRALQSAKSVLSSAPGKRIFHSHVIGADNNTTDIQLAVLDSILQIERLINISLGEDLNEQIFTMQTGLDSTVMLLGSTDDSEAPFFLTKLDSLGNEIWTHSYNGDFGRLIGGDGYDLIQLVDSSWIVVGSVLPSGIEGTGSFLLHVDNDGNIIQGRTFTPIANQHQIFPNGVVGMVDTTVVLSMKRLNDGDGIVQPLLIKYDLDTTISYQSLLDTCLDISSSNSELVTVDSISASFMTTTVKDDIRIPYVAKADMTGNTQCNLSEVVVKLDSVAFIRSELAFASLDTMVIDSVDIDTDPFSNFSPPILSLPDTIYCPQDPINFFVDGSVRGGVSYIWEDGSTSPTRTLTEEGMFMLTVSVREDICFTLCDTMTITQRDFPSVTIEKDFGDFCETGRGVLEAVPMGPQIRTFEWNDGSMDEIRFVDGVPAMYSVSLVDICDNSASANIEVTEADLIPPILAEIVRNCNTLTVTGTGFIGQTWSNNATTASINVSTPGTYSVILQDQCGDNVDTPIEITLTEADFPPPLDASILLECGDPRVLSLVGSGIANQMWSTGETSSSIEITSAGTFTVTVTGQSITTPSGTCENTVVENIEVSQAELDNSTGCLLWPNALFPLSNDVENQSFGPVIKDGCGSLVSYEMRIYNRWGKNIFTSTDFNNRWDGRIGSNNQPGGVYFYWARYDDGSTVCEREGDLTLIR